MYSYNGKELYSDFSDSYSGVYDFGARYYNPLYGRWFAHDPAKQGINPYVYCGNSPVMSVDPDGAFFMLLRGDFISAQGVYLGTDGIKDGRIYVVKTNEALFNDSGRENVKGAGLSRKLQKETEKFIKANSGNSVAFEQNSIAYDNSIEIEGNASIRQQMLDAVGADNGMGKTFDYNNREYGGRINPQTREIEIVPPGDVVDLTKEERPSINIPGGASSFHSHASGYVIVRTNDGFQIFTHTQHPSSPDLKTAGNYVHYVFGKGNNMTYIYDKNAIQAVIPTKYFIRPQNVR